MKRVLITGATGNIGQACVVYADSLQWLIRGVSRHGSDDPRIDAADLSRWDVVNYWTYCQQPFDLVIMAHGVQIPATVEHLTEDVWQAVLSNNLSSAVALTHTLKCHEKLTDDSLIVYCSSIQAYTPRAGRGAYAAAKAGLEAFGKVVAAELAPQTRVISLRLGQLTETMAGIEFPVEERVKLESRMLLPWVMPTDVAKLIWALYEQKSMTGCVIDVDSGHGRNVW